MADARLDTLVRIFRPEKAVPVEIKYWDVPAAVGESREGGGIGGLYLNLLQGADALLHVVRAFQDPTVPHVRGSVDPARDMADMEVELTLSDLAIVERRVRRIEAQLKGSKGRERDLLLREGDLLQRLRDGLEAGLPVRAQEVPGQTEDVLSNYQLLTAKPLVTVVNVDEAAPHDGAGLEGAGMDGTGKGAVLLSAKLEMELAQLGPEDEAAFRDSMGLREAGAARVVQTSFRLLSLICFFTYVSGEVRAWTVPASTPAVRAAGKIHSDMERGFIRAEVVSFGDLAACGSVAQCKKQGLVRLEGKEYPVQDGDVITFLFNT
jgi:GTP-binding protein YchF